MERKALPDLMKGLAVVMMVQVHIMELFARPEVYDSVLGRISLFLGGPFAAPVFLAVMGYFLAASRRTHRSLTWRGVKLLLLGLALNIGLNLNLLIKIYSGAIDENPWKYILGADILFVAGFSIIIISFLKKIFKENILSYAILMIIIPVIVIFIPETRDQAGIPLFIGSFFWMKTSWSYFPVIPWISYALLGYISYLSEKDFPQIVDSFRQKRAVIIISLLAVLVLTSVYPFRVITHLPEYYHHGIFTFLWDAGFIVLLALGLETIHKEFSGTTVLRYLRWLGKNVTVVYVIQWLFIGNIGTAIYRTQHFLWLVVWFIMILAMSSFLTYIYNLVYERRR